MKISRDDPIFPEGLQATSFGLWCYTAQNGFLYSSQYVELDSKFEAARALGTTTICLGFCVWLFYLLAGCCRFGPMTFRIVGFFCFCCSVFQGLVFLVKKSAVCSDWCGLDTGGNCAIAAIVLWFIASNMSCAAGKLPEEEEEVAEEVEEDAEKGEE